MRMDGSHPLPALCAALVALGVSSCTQDTGKSASQAARSEDLPAPPCSVNAMLLRDVAPTEFESCPSISGTIEGAAADCIRDALAHKTPFTATAKVAGLAKFGPSPVLVGAEFSDGYGLRVYEPSLEGTGRRTTTTLMVTSATSGSLALSVGLGDGWRCERSPTPPSLDDPGWVDIRPDGIAKFSARHCLEWFDDAAWADYPRQVSSAEMAGFTCDAP